METQLVEITIAGGAVQNVECPPGIKVVIKDYDVEGSDWDGFDIRTDEDGDSYQYMEFLSEDDEPESEKAE